MYNSSTHDCKGWCKSGPFIFCVAPPAALGAEVSGMVRLGPGPAASPLQTPETPIIYTYSTEKVILYAMVNLDLDL